MVHVDPKFTQLVNQQRQSEGNDPYAIDLRKDTVAGPGTNQMFFSLCGCEHETVGTNCNCQTTVPTGCASCFGCMP